MHQTIEKLQGKLRHPFSISLMQTREKVLKVDYLAFIFFYVSFIFKGEIHLRPNGFIIVFFETSSSGSNSINHVCARNTWILGS